MKKILLIVFILATGSFILSSCGGSGEKKAVSSEKTTKTTETKAKVEKQYTVDIKNGEAVYNKVCIACHMTGVAGAPALKDKERWTEIAQKGMKQLHQDAIDGFTGDHGVMPARGTCTDCSDQDLYDAIGYMLQKAGVSAE